MGVFADAERLAPEDWQLPHARGVCLSYLGRHDDAEAALQLSLSLCRQESTFVALARARERRGVGSGDAAAVATAALAACTALEEGLEHFPDSPSLLTRLGELWLSQGAAAAAVAGKDGAAGKEAACTRASTLLIAALRADTHNAPALLAAAAAALEGGSDAGVALAACRAAATSAPASATLWNTVGGALFRRGKLGPAAACLRRSAALDPLSWAPAYNAALVLMHAGQPASAFQHLSACVHLRPAHAPAYALLGACLTQLGDAPNAVAAYERAVALQPDDAEARAALAAATAAAARDE